MTTADDESLRSAGLTAKERLARIEDILTSIVTKLDGKADLMTVAALELRIREIEVRGTRLSQEAMTEARRIADERLEDINKVANQIETLERAHEKLSNKVSWAFGAVAAAVLASDLIMRIVIK